MGEKKKKRYLTVNTFEVNGSQFLFLHKSLHDNCAESNRSESNPLRSGPSTALALREYEVSNPVLAFITTILLLVNECPSKLSTNLVAHGTMYV